MSASRQIRRIEHKTVVELFDYTPDTGALIWRKRDIRWFQDGRSTAEQDCRKWNARFAGHPAGALNREGYLNVDIFGTKYRGHRIIWLWMTGIMPERQIDHINGDRIDNRWINLREATSAENSRNRGMNRKNTSGFTGVCWFKPRRKWIARIHFENRPKHLGYFDTAEDAHAAYCQAAEQLGFTDRHARGTSA